MDRTSWIAVIACLGAMFFYVSWEGKKAKQRAADQAAAAPAAETAPAAPGGAEAPQPTEGAAPDTDAGSTPAAATPAPSPAPLQEATPPSTDDAAPGADTASATTPETTPASAERQEFILENESVRFHLTNFGGGVARAEQLHHLRSLDGDNGFVTINGGAKAPIGALSTGPGQVDIGVWAVTKHTDTEVVFMKDGSDGLRVQKRYWLPQRSAPTAEGDDDAGQAPDPHLLNLQITIRNISEAPMIVSRRFLYTGTAKPLHGREWTREVGYYWKGDDDMEFESIDRFGKGMFRKASAYDDFQIEELSWAGVNDQFYTTMIRAEEVATGGMWASRFPVIIEGQEELSKKKKLHGVEGGVGLPDITLNVGDQRTLNYEFFIGPKEYARLSKLGGDRTGVMHYDELPVIGFLFGWAIRPLAALLITILSWMHNFVPYGVAIILITILIRIVIWPLYAKSTRTMKRMSKLTPKMKEIKEQYKDDPQKQNQEIMGLYRKYGVNPLGGCLPMFIQMPIFLGFYRMLSSAVELRHQSFLWVEDLSMPDTLFMIPGTEWPFNLLPILMAVTMVIQMKVAPQSGDATQRMIFMFMPVLFLVICYNFAAALSLYWTTQNLFSIGQTWLMNKLPEPELKKKKLKDAGGKGFMQRLQEKAEEQQKAKRNQIAGEKGQRHTPGKGKKRKKR